ncbi:MAG: cadherin-like domain-containing protein [Chloroflexota bacterium]
MMGSIRGVPVMISLLVLGRRLGFALAIFLYFGASAKFLIENEKKLPGLLVTLIVGVFAVLYWHFYSKKNASIWESMHLWTLGSSAVSVFIFLRPPIPVATFCHIRSYLMKHILLSLLILLATILLGACSTAGPTEAASMPAATPPRVNPESVPTITRIELPPTWTPANFAPQEPSPTKNIEQPAKVTNTPTNAFQDVALPSEEASLGIPMVASTYGALHGGEVFTYPVSLEGGYTMFGALWQTGMGTLHLLDENGNLVNEAFALSHPEIVSYTADATGAVYILPDAASGEWQMILHSTDMPAEGTFYQLMVFSESAIGIYGTLDRTWYAPGETATISATLSGEYANANVWAVVHLPKGASEVIELSSVGDGLYQGDYTVPDTPGYVEISFFAEGTTAGGIAFNREISQLFTVSPQSFSLSGSYSDGPEVQAENPAMYQALAISVGVNSTISGTVMLSADLVDAEGNFVAHTNRMQDSQPGENMLTLRFNGADIYASQRNGPYTLTHILLSDMTELSVTTAESDDVYVTAPYLWQDFEIPRANQEPITADDTGSTMENTSVIIDVLANDSDPDGDALVIVGMIQPDHGQVITNTDQTITYIPQENYYGIDSFSYIISDPDGAINIANVQITVTSVGKPAAASEVLVTVSEIPILLNVLESDIGGDFLTVIPVKPSYTLC